LKPFGIIGTEIELSIVNTDGTTLVLIPKFLLHVAERGKWD